MPFPCAHARQVSTRLRDSQREHSGCILSLLLYSGAKSESMCDVHPAPSCVASPSFLGVSPSRRCSISLRAGSGERAPEETRVPRRVQSPETGGFGLGNDLKSRMAAARGRQGKLGMIACKSTLAA